MPLRPAGQRTFEAILDEIVGVAPAAQQRRRVPRRRGISASIWSALVLTTLFIAMFPVGFFGAGPPGKGTGQRQVLEEMERGVRSLQPDNSQNPWISNAVARQ